MTELINTLISIALYTNLLICVIGFIGNVLAFIVLSRQIFKNTIFDVYIRVMIISNSLELTYPVYCYLLYNHQLDFLSLSKIICVFSYYIFFVAASISSWILVIVSLDRMISLHTAAMRSSTFAFSFKNKKQFHFGLTLLIIAYNFIFYFHVPLFSEFKVNNKTNLSDYNSFEYKAECVLNDDGIGYWMDLFNLALVPFFLMTIFTIKKVIVLFESRKRISKINSKDVRFAAISLTLNVWFFVTIFPVSLYIITVKNILQWKTEIASEHIHHHLVFNILLDFYALYYGSFFFVNFFINSLFRIECKNIFKEIKWNTRREEIFILN